MAGTAYVSVINGTAQVICTGC